MILPERVRCQSLKRITYHIKYTIYPNDLYGFIQRSIRSFPSYHRACHSGIIDTNRLCAFIYSRLNLNTKLLGDFYL